LGEVSLAEQLLQAALKLDSKCDSALYHLALLHHRERKNTQSAMALLQQVLAQQPEHANATLALARVLTDRLRLSEVSPSLRILHVVTMGWML
jgi:cytochrome c-type biogenesis protein CcmH/NrfG